MLIVTMAFFAMLETGYRVYFYATTLNSYYLLFGLATDISKHNNKQDGYFKFFPSKTLHQGTGSHSIPTQINSHGFRGQNFTTKKGDTIRIVAMGGSSTFGYYSRDQYTYPAQLQSFLNETSNLHKQYEVINTGIPHMQTKHIVKMLTAELLSFQPDLLTLYSACNDTWNLYSLYRKHTEKKVGKLTAALFTVKDFLIHHSLAFHKANSWYISSDFSSFRFKIRKTDSKLNKTTVQLFTSQKISKKEFNFFSATVLQEYKKNLQEIINISQKNNTPLLLIKQKYTLNKLQTRSRESTLPYAKANSYSEEVEMAKQRMQEQGWLWIEEASLLTHSSLTAALETIAKTNDIQLIDSISNFDKDPDNLVSYVHLSEKGNAVLAKTIGTQISQLFE